jgi:hypothetical protein
MNDATEQRLAIAKRNAATYLATCSPKSLTSSQGNFRERLNTAGNQLGELIEETFALVEQHMPEVDITEAKKRYKLWSDKF